MIQSLILLLSILLSGTYSVYAQSSAAALPSNPGNLAMRSSEDRIVRPQPTALPTVVASPRQSTNRVLLTQRQHRASLLLHLKNDQPVSFRVTNAVGGVVQTSPQTTFGGGFYELPLLNDFTGVGIYTVKLMVGDQVMTFKIAY